MATVFSLLSSGSLLGKATASASGGVLVMTTGGLMSAPRLMLVPAATRLPSGVHAVVPVQASGRRRAMPVAARADSGYTADGDQVSFDMFKAKAYKVVPVQAGALPGAAASGRRRAMPMAAGGEWAYTDEEDHYKNSDLSLKKFVKTKASEALGLIQKNLPLDEHLLAEWNKIEDDLHFAALVEGIGDTKTAVVEYVLTLIGAAYDIVNYTNRCYLSTRPTPHYQIKIQGATSSPPPSSGTPFVALKDGTFLAFDFGPGNHDTSRMVLAINRAMYLATAATDAYLNTI